ncbi:hypothetical protein MBLNU230_g7501t1 [Neophaeotheca triangularis]
MATITHIPQTEQNDRGRSTPQPPYPPTGPSASSARGITFGIELEFLVICNKIENWMASLGQVQAELVGALEAPWHGNCSLPGCNQQHEIIVPVNEPGQKLPYTRWGVDSDGSVGVNREDVYAMKDSRHMSIVEYGMEITSRILEFDPTPPPIDADSWDPTSHEPFTDSFWEIALVLNRLHDVSRTSRYKLLVNRSCGMHVHVGNGNRGFPLSAIRNTVAITTVFERLWDSVQAQNRISDARYGRFATAPRRRQRRNSFATIQPVPRDPNVWAKPFSYNALYAAWFTRREEEIQRHNPTGKCPTPYERLDWPRNLCNDNDPGMRAACKSMDALAWYYIQQSATNLFQLKWLYNVVNAKQSTVCLNHLSEEAREDDAEVDDDDPYPGPPKSETIEFRQHAGSLNFEEIKAWVCAVVSLVQFSEKSSLENVNNLVLSDWANLRMTFPDLLKKFGTDRRTRKFYYDKLTDERLYSERLEEALMDPFKDLDPQLYLHQILHIIVQNSTQPHSRMKDAIRQKLEQGGFGQFPLESLKAVTPPLDPEVTKKVSSFYREEGSGDFTNPPDSPAPPKTPSPKWVYRGAFPFRRRRRSSSTSRTSSGPQLPSSIPSDADFDMFDLSSPNSPSKQPKNPPHPTASPELLTDAVFQPTMRNLPSSPSTPSRSQRSRHLIHSSPPSARSARNNLPFSPPLPLPNITEHPNSPSPSPNPNQKPNPNTSSPPSSPPPPIFTPLPGWGTNAGSSSAKTTASSPLPPTTHHLPAAPPAPNFGRENNNPASASASQTPDVEMGENFPSTSSSFSPRSTVSSEEEFPMRPRRLSGTPTPVAVAFGFSGGRSPGRIDGGGRRRVVVGGRKGKEKEEEKERERGEEVEKKSEDEDEDEGEEGMGGRKDDDKPGEGVVLKKKWAWR